MSINNFQFSPIIRLLLLLLSSEKKLTGEQTIDQNVINFDISLLEAQKGVPASWLGS